MSSRTPHRLPSWTAALAAAVVCAAAPAMAAPVAPARIERPAALVLVRSALIALDQANKTGNYTVLRDLGGPAFSVNTAARLSEVFADLRSQSVDLTSVLAAEPVFTLPPHVEASGLLRTKGYVDSGPRRLNFEIAWQPVGGVWRLYGMVVTTSELVGPPVPSR